MNDDDQLSKPSNSQSQCSAEKAIIVEGRIHDDQLSRPSKSSTENTRIVPGTTYDDDQLSKRSQISTEKARIVAGTVPVYNDDDQLLKPSQSSTEKDSAKILRRVLTSPRYAQGLPPIKKAKRPEGWSTDEERAFVQFIAIHRDLQAKPDVQWPATKLHDPYWQEAASFIKDVSGASVTRTAGAIRARMKQLRAKFKTIDEAETAHGLTVEGYISQTNNLPAVITTVAPSLSIDQLKPLLEKLFTSLPTDRLVEALTRHLSKLDLTEATSVVDSSFTAVAEMESSPKDCLSHIIVDHRIRWASTELLRGFRVCEAIIKTERI